jgi:hypothetical protein
LIREYLSVNRDFRLLSIMESSQNVVIRRLSRAL